MRRSGRWLFRGRKLPCGLLGTLAMLLAVELYLHDQRDHYTPDLPASWRHAGRAASRDANGADVLCFGDSMVKFGVLPPILDATFGGRSYNLALHAGPPSAAYYLLRRAVEAGAGPRAIIVDFGPHQLARDPRHPEFRRCWPELADIRECLDLASATRDPEFLGSLLLARSLPSYLVRHEVRTQIVAALDGRAWSARAAVRALQRNWEANQGAQVLAKRPGYDGSIPAVHDGLYPASWRPDPVTLGYVRRFLELARDQNIRVFWLLPPLSPAVQERRRQLGLDETFDRLASRLQALFPGLTIVDARHAGYDLPVFVDAVHLDREGAAVLTEDLAATIQNDLRSLQASRDVKLPAYRARSVPHRIEDLDESILALRHARESTRRR